MPSGDRTKPCTAENHVSTFLKLTDKYHTDSIQYVNPTYVRSLKEFEGGTQISFADGGTLTVDEKITVVLDSLQQATRGSARTLN